MKNVIFALLIVFLVAVSVSPVFETPVAMAGPDSLNQVINNQLIRLNNTGLPGDADENKVLDSVVNLVQLLLGTVAIIFFILILWAGFMWMTAAGNQERIDKAKKMIGSALIGLLVIMFSYAITVFVFTIMMKSAATT